MTTAAPTHRRLSFALEDIIRWTLGLIFIWAGCAKIAGANAFFIGLLTYELPLPESFLRWVAITLPWLELLGGVALLGNFWPETIRPLVAFLCALFVGLLAQAMARGLEVDCSCFSGGSFSWLERREIALPRAVILLIAAGYLAGVWQSVFVGSRRRHL